MEVGGSSGSAGPPKAPWQRRFAEDLAVTIDLSDEDMSDAEWTEVVANFLHEVSPEEEALTQWYPEGEEMQLPTEEAEEDVQLATEEAEEDGELATELATSWGRRRRLSKKTKVFGFDEE